ncbi:hypothetical protein GW17_00051587, partial [Ensete ventricosum]
TKVCNFDLYRLVRVAHTGLPGCRYADRPLPSGSVKNRSLAVDFGRRRPVLKEIDRRRSIEEEKGKKKRKRKKEEEGNKEYLASAILARLLSPPAGCPHAVAARGSPATAFSPARGDRSRRRKGQAKRFIGAWGWSNMFSNRKKHGKLRREVRQIFCQVACRYYHLLLQVFLIIRRSLKRCSALTKNQTLFNLFEVHIFVFQRILKAYATKLYARLPKGGTGLVAAATGTDGQIKYPVSNGTHSNKALPRPYAGRLGGASSLSCKTRRRLIFQRENEALPRLRVRRRGGTSSPSRKRR